MDRNRRFEAIAACDGERLASLAEQVLAGGARPAVLRGPAAGSVMMRARDPGRGGLFNLGEVTATEAEVEIAGERGYALVLGVEPRRALAGAIVDAAAEAMPELRPVIEHVLGQALLDDERRREARALRVEGTRVQFDEIP
jgi:alpha-D-ribose 1-methylphosphonate 5-triphosphate synthase subunit PhnG